MSISITITTFCEIQNLNFAGGKRTITSLCPAIGKTHAVLYSGYCPDQLRNPHGKEFNISFIGPKPYISYDPIGGSDFEVTNILAKKFKFIPKFVPERSYDIVKSNVSTYGMLHRVC